MAKSRKILFISAEVAPFAKRGGLGDVAGSLPKALESMGHDVRVIMPAYKNIEDGFSGVTATDIVMKIWTNSGTVQCGVFEGVLPDTHVPVYFIAQLDLFYRDEIYGYDDDPYRFAFFSRAALELTRVLEWTPDVLHAHDWHTAPAITWLATAGQWDRAFQGISTVFTIHNLAHQGRTSWDIFNYLGIHTHTLQDEPYGQVNFMARGIYHATMVNTVSPTYAREIMTVEGGANLDALLRHRSYDVHGILNGIDVDTWNPSTDTRLPFHYGVDALNGRYQNRRTLQERMGLPQIDNIPIIAMIARLDWQKGLDIVGHALHLLMNGYSGPAQFVLLGSGQPQYENMFRQLAQYHGDKMAAVLEYNAGLAPLIYAGSDIFLMPSLFEPCGLGQMIAMRYGSVPLVRAVGGLADTVRDGSTGFVFHDFTSDALWMGLQKAIYVYNVDKPRWAQIQQNGMASDFSWARSAQGYNEMYEWAIARTHS